MYVIIPKWNYFYCILMIHFEMLSDYALLTRFLKNYNTISKQKKTLSMFYQFYIWKLTYLLTYLVKNKKKYLV